MKLPSHTALWASPDYDAHVVVGSGNFAMFCSRPPDRRGEPKPKKPAPVDYVWRKRAFVRVRG
jgi:hypothetical protein